MLACLSVWQPKGFDLCFSVISTLTTSHGQYYLHFSGETRCSETWASSSTARPGPSACGRGWPIGLISLIMSHVLSLSPSGRSPQAAVWLSATPRTVVPQAPLSMGFPRQEYWSVWPRPSPGDLPDPGIKLRSPALQLDSTRFSQVTNRKLEFEDSPQPPIKTTCFSAHSVLTEGKQLSKSISRSKWTAN